MAAGCVGVPFLTCNTTALIVEMTSCVCLLPVLLLMNISGHLLGLSFYTV